MTENDFFKKKKLILIRGQNRNKTDKLISVHNFERSDLLFRRRSRTKRVSFFKTRRLLQQKLSHLARLRHVRKYAKIGRNLKLNKTFKHRKHSAYFFNHNTFFSAKQSFRKPFRFILGGLMSPFNLSNKLRRIPEEGIARIKLRKN